MGVYVPPKYPFFTTVVKQNLNPCIIRSRYFIVLHYRINKAPANKKMSRFENAPDMDSSGYYSNEFTRSLDYLTKVSLNG